MKAHAPHYMTMREARASWKRIEVVSQRTQLPPGQAPTSSPNEGHKGRLLLGGKLARAISSEPDRHRMNKGEAAFARALAERFATGEIHWWMFEPLNFRLADNTNYRPDFLIIARDWSMEAIDVKGRSGNGPWVEEDAMVKIKVAARTFPWLRWRLVWPAKGGGWCEREVGACEASNNKLTGPEGPKTDE